jgi:hypothetical protein
VFDRALRFIRAGKHRTRAGLNHLARLAGQMNRQKVPRFTESSETVRRIRRGAERYSPTSAAMRRGRAKSRPASSRRARSLSSNRRERSSLSGKFRRA